MKAVLSVYLLILIFSMYYPTIAQDIVFPSGEWDYYTPLQAGMDRNYLETARSYAEKSGGSGLIIRFGRIVMQWGDIKKTYDLKSSTKSFGSIALGLALKDGKINLNDKARKYLPSIGIEPESNLTNDWLDQITILQLASQTAGFEKPGGFTPLLFKPGTMWDYSDSGPNWLADILTTIYKRDISEVMFERVFTPLGITASDLFWRKNAYRPQTLDGVPRREFGAGIYANVDAMARIGLLMLRNGKWKNQQILDPDYVNLATKVPDGNEKLKSLHPETYGNAPSHYGLLWWNNQDGTLPDFPREAFWSWGLYDSLILVIPSLDIVVARAGNSFPRTDKEHYSVLEPFFIPIAQSVLSSVKIKEIIWDNVNSVIKKAKGSDNFPITWAGDDYLYTAYGDGYGFEPFLKEKLSLGIARISGYPPDFHGENIRSKTIEQKGDGKSGIKASGLLAVDDLIYLLARNAGNSRIAFSKDYGKTWSWTEWKFAESFGCPTFLNCGKNYKDAPNDYVYIFSPDNNSAYEFADRVILARVHKTSILEKSAYDYFQDLDIEGNPVWTKDFSRRGAVLSNPGKCYRMSVSFNKPLNRYLLIQTGQGDNGKITEGLTIYESKYPWGRWTPVFSTRHWDIEAGESANFPTKWISPDGKSIYLVFSDSDCFAVRKATLIIRSE
ncbi:MAG: serine hydrolase [Verrucomicrobiia bacterium]